MIEIFPDVNAVERSSGQSALHKAAEVGDVAMVSTLLKFGANVLITDSHGRTPVDAALAEGREEVVTLLKQTDLHSAAKNNELETVRGTLQREETLIMLSDTLD